MRKTSDRPGGARVMLLIRLLVLQNAAAVALAAGSAQQRASILFCSPYGLLKTTNGWLDLGLLRLMRNGSFDEAEFEVDWTETLDDMNKTRLFKYNAVVLFKSPDSLDSYPPYSAATRTAFMPLLTEYMQAGGGVLLYPTEESVIGQQLFDVTDALDVKIPQEYLNESNASNVASTTHMSGFGGGGTFPLYWTENISHDPSLSTITKGVSGLWYPAQAKYNSAQGGPLWLGPDWTPVLFATSTTSTVPHNLTSTTYVPLPPKNQIFQRSVPAVAPPLMAVRIFRKARVAIFNQWHQFTFGSGTRWLYDSQVLSRGAKGRPSDFGTLLCNTLGWLAAPSMSSGSVGGYVMPADKLQDPNSAAAVAEAYKESHSSYTYAQLASGPAPDGKKAFRGLIGARSTLSSGTSTVAEIAAAARSSKLDFVVVLEDYCFLANASNGANASLSTLIQACKQASTPTLTIFPGFTLKNNLGESMFVWGPIPIDGASDGRSIENPPSEALVPGPGGCPVLDLQPASPTNASRYTGYMGGGSATTFMFQQSELRGFQVGFYNLGPNRPGAPGTRTAKSLKMYACLATMLYEDNELIEDITDDYLLHTQSTMTGIPVAVNLVHSAQGIIDAVAKAQSLTHVRAVSLKEIYPDSGFLTRDGSTGDCGLRWNSQYDSSSVFVSNGPLVTAWSSTLHVASLGAERFVTGRALMPAGLAVQSAVALKQISIYNGQTLFRRIGFGDKLTYNYSHTLLLEGWIQRNLVVIAEDMNGGKAVTFPRKAVKSGIHHVQFCSDHVNDCHSGGDVLLAHGPMTPPSAWVTSLPGSIAGYTWDGGPLAQLPIQIFETAGTSQAKVEVSTTGGHSETTANMVITPLLETADEGVVVVAVNKTQLYSELLDRVVNEWHTAGPEGRPSKIIDVLFRYHEYFSASSGTPSEGYAGFPTAVDTVATIFSADIVFKNTWNVTQIGYAKSFSPPSVDAVFVVCWPNTSTTQAQTFDLAKLANTSTVGCTIQHGGWFGLYSAFDSNSHIYFVSGDAIDIACANPATAHGWFAMYQHDETNTMKHHGRPFHAGDKVKASWVQFGISMLTPISSTSELVHLAQYVQDASGCTIVRGQKAADSPGLLEVALDDDLAVEITATQYAADQHMMLPLKITGCCANWTAGLYQRVGWTQGHYTNGTGYSALGVDASGHAHVPLYTGRGAAHIIAGHPVIAVDESGKPLYSIFVQVTHVDVDNATLTNTWHLSVNNPTEQDVVVRLHSSFGLPDLQLSKQKFTVRAGELIDVLPAASERSLEMDDPAAAAKTDDDALKSAVKSSDESVYSVYWDVGSMDDCFEKAHDGRPCRVNPQSKNLSKFGILPWTRAVTGSIQSFPMMQPDGLPYAGGVPQMANFTEQMTLIENLVKEWLPDEAYSGLAIFDYEEWQPVWESNWGCRGCTLAQIPHCCQCWNCTGCPRLSLYPIGMQDCRYQSYSIELARRAHPALTLPQLIAQAKKEFTAASVALYVDALKTAKRLRPHATWGFYNTLGDHMGGIDAITRAALPIFKEAQAIFPSIYMDTVYNDSQEAHFIHTRTNASVRIAQLVGGDSPPQVIPFVMQMKDSPKAGPLPLLTPAEIEQEFFRPYDLGASGVIVFNGNLTGHAAYWEHTQSVLGPAIRTFLDSVNNCSVAQCNGHGRCVPRGSTTCVCFAKYHGTRCESHKTDDFEAHDNHMIRGGKI